MSSIYFDVSKVGSYSSVANLRKAANSLGHNYSIGAVKRWLDGQEVYGITKQSFDKHETERHIQAAGVDSRWEVDLIDFHSFCSSERRMCYAQSMFFHDSPGAGL